jgi:hypothetical protein
MDNKYFKYKNKYLNLKNQNGGSGGSNVHSDKLIKIDKNEIQTRFANLYDKYKKNEIKYNDIYTFLDVLKNIDSLINKYETKIQLLEHNNKTNEMYEFHFAHSQQSMDQESINIEKNEIKTQFANLNDKYDKYKIKYDDITNIFCVFKIIDSLINKYETKIQSLEHNNKTNKMHRFNLANSQQPINHQPIDQQEMDYSPMYQQQMNQQPMNQQSMYQQPMNQQQMNQQTMNQQSMYQQPMNQQSMYQQPMNQQSMYQQPMYQQPMYQQPSLLSSASSGLTSGLGFGLGMGVANSFFDDSGNGE